MGSIGKEIEIPSEDDPVPPAEEIDDMKALCTMDEISQILKHLIFEYLKFIKS